MLGGGGGGLLCAESKCHAHVALLATPPCPHMLVRCCETHAGAAGDSSAAVPAEPIARPSLASRLSIAPLSAVGLLRWLGVLPSSWDGWPSFLEKNPRWLKQPRRHSRHGAIGCCAVQYCSQSRARATPWLQTRSASERDPATTRTQPSHDRCSDNARPVETLSSRGRDGTAAVATTQTTGCASVPFEQHASVVESVDDPSRRACNLDRRRILGFLPPHTPRSAAKTPVPRFHLKRPRVPNTRLPVDSRPVPRPLLLRRSSGRPLMRQGHDTRRAFPERVYVSPKPARLLRSRRWT